jgi:hypothetical protein
MPTLDWLDRDAAFRVAHRVPTRSTFVHCEQIDAALALKG